VTSILHAAAVTVGVLSQDVEHAAWSEDGGDGPNLIILRRHADPDGYTLIINDIPRFGGVLAHEVVPGETRLTLTAEAAHELGVERDVVLRYDPTAVDADELRAALGRLLGSPDRGGPA
jgi:hypothetical protein